jgi:phosphoglycerate dehydrogenase-like enzyme
MDRRDEFHESPFEQAANRRDELYESHLNTRRIGGTSYTSPNLSCVARPAEGCVLENMNWKVLITASGVAQSGERAQALLRDAGCEVIFPKRFGPFKAPELTAMLGGIDAVLASLDEFSSPVLGSPAAAQLKMVARWGVGFDSVDVAAATRNGIVVTYTPGVLDDAVADYTMALLLAAARRVCEGHDAVRANQWKRFPGFDVAGKTLGIIGYGRIGQAVARRAAGFNLRILAHTPHPKPAAGIEFVGLDALLEQSDFVSLHAALTPTNQRLLGESQFQRMKPTALLINTARGALVDENALARALGDGTIAGAALDAFVTEPLPADSVLRSAPNLLLSPHQSSFGRDTGERVSLTAAQAIVDWLRGKPPENILNPEVLKSAVLRGKVAS